MDNYLEPEFKPLYEGWKKNPTPASTSTVLKAMDPIIDSSLKTFAGSSTSPTLRSKAKLIVVNSLNSYDPTKSKLRTHMMTQLQGLRRISAKENQILSVPEQVAIESNKLHASENFLRDKLDREPSDSELADHMGLSLKRIGYIRKAKPAFAEGMIASSGNTDEGEGIYSPEVEDNRSLQAWHEFIYHDLEPTDQSIMEYTLGLHGKKVLSNQRLAELLKISPGAVSQRKQRIQNKLNMRDELNVF